MQKHPMFQYVKAGLYLQGIRQPLSFDVKKGAQNVMGLKQVAGDFGFTQALKHIARLEKFFKPGHTYSQMDFASMEQLSLAIYDALEEETRDRLLVELDRSISPKLLAWPKARQLTASQKHLWEETIRCLESRAYRAGIVMAWALAYDVIRWSIWTDQQRLDELKQSWKGRSDLKTDNEHEFIGTTMGEWEFLDSCRLARLLGGRSDVMHAKLSGLLRERNEYAHANDIPPPTMFLANAFIEKLVEIISEKPFM